MKPPLLILTGPTGSGKTALSISLAKAIDGEIISADSMQVYQQMDIGSAKIMPTEQQGIPHHLIDILAPDEEFHVVMFQQLAKEATSQIYQRGRVPIVVGGTGFYIQALLYDINFTEARSDFTARCEWESIAEIKGSPTLHQMLQEVDPEAAKQIHPNNVKRVIRALEFHAQTGEKISHHNATERHKESPFNYVYFVLNDKRERLYQRIDTRVDEMIDKGLVGEVANLKAQGYGKELVSMQGLGYKEILSYLEGDCTIEEAIYLLKRDTRHFAKRQLTWFRRERDVIWLNKQDFDYSEEALIQKILEITKNRGIVDFLRDSVGVLT